MSMDQLSALLAPLAMLLSGAAAVNPPSDTPAVEPVVASIEKHLVPPPEAADPAAETLGWTPIADSFRAPVEQQVRIERSITIRIAPRAPLPPADFADLPARMPARMSERRMARCVPIGGIAGVQVSRDNRLLLFMRDQRIVSLGLEKACRARDFYSGFYVERSSDGQICVERDRLQSRSGANCALTRMRQLIAE
jgi:hypothetical protein